MILKNIPNTPLNNMKIMLKFILAVALVTTTSFASAGWNPGSKAESEAEAREAVAEFKKDDSDIKIYFDEAYGYAVFPTVGKAGLGIGGAHGKGLVYEQGQAVGTTTLNQLSFGFQWGGQAYSEVVFFENKTALDDFKKGNFELGAQASAVAVTAGASTNLDYSDGVAIITRVKGGLMYEASVGGQKFGYDAY